jgi:hypothetical protein
VKKQRLEGDEGCLKIFRLLFATKSTRPSHLQLSLFPAQLLSMKLFVSHLLRRLANTSTSGQARTTSFYRAETERGATKDVVFANPYTLQRKPLYSTTSFLPPAKKHR